MNPPAIHLSMWEKALSEGPDGTYIDLEVSPGSSSQGIRGYDEWRNRIKISLKAEPRDGKANAELISMLGDILDTPPGDIQITSGQTSGQKRVLVKKLDVKTIKQKLGEHLGPC